jgi:glycosyltransferase involved in cell wall biosynthesis
MIGVAVRAAKRLRAKGHAVRVVYDAHEFLPGVGGPSQHWQIAHESYEAAHIREADGVITVSDVMARRIQQQHGLPVLPTVVMNCPPAESGDGSGDLRARLGLAPDVPILVYAGVAAAKRGLTATVRALPLLPDVHLAFMSKPGPYIDEMRKLAADLGVTERLHVVGYVPVDDVVHYMSTATLGLQTVVKTVNHEVTIATKYFDYAQARLPIVQSDVRAMAALTRSIGCGEVFVAEDVDSFVAATSAVLADLPRYRAAYDRPGLLEAWTWEAQAGVLAELYRRLVATPVGTPVEPVPTVGR